MFSLYADMTNLALHSRGSVLMRSLAQSQALKSDGWNTEPFSLSEDKETGRFYGRGSSDDKGPILGWLNVRFERAGAPRKQPELTSKLLCRSSRLTLRPTPRCPST